MTTMPAWVEALRSPQREMMQLYLDGFTSREIGATLFFSPTLVEKKLKPLITPDLKALHKSCLQARRELARLQRSTKQRPLDQRRWQLLSLYEDGIPLSELANMEEVTEERIRQILKDILTPDVREHHELHRRYREDLALWPTYIAIHIRAMHGQTQAEIMRELSVSETTVSKAMALLSANQRKVRDSLQRRQNRATSLSFDEAVAAVKPAVETAQRAGAQFSQRFYSRFRDGHPGLELPPVAAIYQPHEWRSVVEAAGGTVARDFRWLRFTESDFQKTAARMAKRLKRVPSKSEWSRLRLKGEPSYSSLKVFARKQQKTATELLLEWLPRYAPYLEEAA